MPDNQIVQSHSGQGTITPRQVQTVAGLWAANTLSQIFNSNKDNLRLSYSTARDGARSVANVYRKARRTYNQYKSPAMPKRSSYRSAGSSSAYKKRKYGRKSFKRRRGASSIVHRRRLSARRFGNYRAAKKVKLTIGNFTQRKLVRLRDNLSFTMSREAPGTNQTMHFCMSDVTDPQLMGHAPLLSEIQSTSEYVAPKGAWANPPNDPSTGRVYIPPHNTDYFKTAVVPLCNQFKDQYGKITVIGCKMTIKITNNFLHQHNLPAPSTNVVNSTGSIWYAWRIDPYDYDSGPFPAAPDENLTYSAIKETGKWSMGVIKGSANDVMASKTLNITYGAKKFWPHLMGAPDGMLDQVFVEYHGGAAASPTSTTTFPQMIKHKAIVRLICGPMPTYSKNPLMTGAIDQSTEILPVPVDMGTLNNVAVNIKSEYICSLGDLKQINGFDADSIVYPTKPKLQYTYA